MKDIPKASYLNSIYSGAILGFFFGVGDAIGGSVRLVIGLIAALLFILSSIFFVGGFEKMNEVDPRKKSYWKAHYPRVKHCIVFVSTLILIFIITFRIVNNIKA